MKVVKSISLLLILFAFGFNSCIEEEPKTIPDVYVNFNVFLDLPQNIALKSINNAIKFANEGFDKNGVIVYRFSLDEYLAFDATCPQHIEVSTSISLDDNGAAGTATCSYCKTEYSFFNFGQASSGYPLKRYRVFPSGSYLNVSN